MVEFKALFALFLNEVEDGLTDLVGAENFDEVLQSQFQILHA